MKRAQGQDREHALLLLHNHVDFTKSTLSSLKTTLTDFVYRHEKPTALAKAVIFFVHAELLSSDYAPTQTNIESLREFASLWFGCANLELYFHEIRSCQITQSHFEQLVAASKERSDRKLIQFNIANVLCLIENDTAEEFSEGHSILKRYFQREPFLLESYSDILKMPRALKKSPFPCHLAMSIVKIISTDIFLPCWPQAKTNFSKFIAVLGYWFSDANLKKHFDAIPNSQFTQRLFDSLMQITEEYSADTTRRFFLSQLLRDWLRDIDLKRELQNKPQVKPENIQPGIIQKMLTQGIFSSKNKITYTATESSRDEPSWISSGRPPLPGARQRSMTEEMPASSDGIASHPVRRSSV